MNKQLTTEQIQNLHMFCEKHHIPYYDVQIELVDHFASAIESRWKNEPELSFEKALDDIFKDFGILGFSKIKMNKAIELQKKYERMLWRYVGQFFKVPKIILTLALTLFLFLLFKSTENDSIIVVIYISTLFAFMTIYFGYIYPKYYKIKTKTKKKFLIAKTILGIQVGLVMLPTVSIDLLSYLKSKGYPSFSLWVELIISLIMVSFVFFIFAFSFYVPGKIKQHFEEQFPQFVNT